MLSLNEVFNESYYLEINPEAAEAVTNGSFASGLEHFEAVGINEGLRFSPLIDLNYYKVVANPNLSELTNSEALEHLLGTGIEEGRLFSPFINLDFYKEANPELSDLSNAEALIHLQDIGINEGLQFSSFVDLEEFKSFNSTLADASNFEAFTELSTFGAPKDEGRIRIPLGLGMTIPDEVELHEPEMEAGYGEATITYSKADNQVTMDFQFEGLPYKLDVTRPEDVSTPFNQHLVSVEDGKWQMWIIGELFTAESTFWYDGETKQLIGNEFDIFDEIPTDDTPIDVNGDGVEDISVEVPVVHMFESPIFEGNPDGTASFSYTWQYDQLLDDLGTAGAFVAMLRYELDAPDTVGLYYTEGGLPVSEALTWDDILANIRSGQNFSLITSLEPDPKPDFLASRSNIMEAFSNIYPTLTPDDVVLDFLTGEYSFKELSDRVTHINDPWPARQAILDAETEPVFGNADDNIFDAADPSDEFDGNRDTVFASAGADLVDASQASAPLIPSTLGKNRIYSGTGNDEVLIGSGDRVFGGTGSDLLDASVGSGKNRLYGGEGDDELLAGKNDRLYGGEGNDLLDASVGSGNNRLYGEAGDDIFFAGSGDRLLGGDGNDTFFITVGSDNLITGGDGADAFWIATGEIPTRGNTITDLEIGVDAIGIGGIGAASIDDLVLSQVGDDAVISVSGFDLATLLNTQVSDLEANGNFVFA